MFFQSWNFGTLETIVLTIISVVGALWLWKAGIPSLLSKGYKDVTELRTTERDDALRERDKYKEEIETLEEENKLLRRECTQRMEINLQDQSTIRELKEKIIKGAI